MNIADSRDWDACQRRLLVPLPFWIKFLPLLFCQVWALLESRSWYRKPVAGGGFFSEEQSKCERCGL